MSHYFFSLKSEMELKNLMHTKKLGKLQKYMQHFT